MPDPRASGAVRRVIHTITTKPIGGPVKTTATLLATNDDEWRAGVSVSGAVSDTFRMRVAASKTNYDGTLNNLTTGGKLNGSKGDNLNAKFEEVGNSIN